MMKHETINPEHYQQGSVECIDYIRDRLSYEQYKGALLANVYKYTYRFNVKYKDLPEINRLKAELEDLTKAGWYLHRYQTLIKTEIEAHEQESMRQEVEYDSNDVPCDVEKGFTDE